MVLSLHVLTTSSKLFWICLRSAYVKVINATGTRIHEEGILPLIQAGELLGVSASERWRWDIEIAQYIIGHFSLIHVLFAYLNIPFYKF